MVNVCKLELNIQKSDHITNCYILYDDEKNACVIDPADEFEKIKNEIDKLNLNVEYVILTHGHADHYGALDKLVEYTNSKVYIHKNDVEMIFKDEYSYASQMNLNVSKINRDKILKLNDKDKINVGEIKLEVIHTPGHTAGSICLYEKNLNELFTGDTLFFDSYGRCDLYSGSFNDMVTSLNKLFDFFSDIIIYPGHNKTSNINSTKRWVRMLMAMKGVTLG